MKKRRLKVGRDSLLFLSGLVFSAHEVFIAQVERPSILVFCAMLLGLPAFLRLDERRRAGREDSPE